MSFKGLTTGVSGLKAQARKMEVIGHNLANQNTAGYKKSTVSFHELFSDVIKGASGGDGGNLGGSNPMEVGAGVGIGAIHKVFSQGARQITGRALDFMVDGDDFFVVQNGTNSELMLTRNGSFGLDGSAFLVDNFGNKVMGYTVDRDTQTVGTTAGAVQLDMSALPPRATSLLDWRGNIDPPANQSTARESTLAWEVFSGGENFGSMKISTSGAGQKEDYGSGFYADSVLYRDAAADIQAGLGTIQLNASPTDLVEGFQVGDTISVVQGALQEQRTITAVNTGTRTLTLSSPVAGFAVATAEVTNVSRGIANRGTSGATSVHNDILRSQVAMVDADGRLLASFYRVGQSPAKYQTISATDTASTSTTVGTGEFTSMKELKELIEKALQDDALSYHTTSSDLSVDVDKFGRISFGGTGLVQDFRLVVNADNTEMLDRFTGIAITDNGAVATTQARVDANGQVITPPSLALGTRVTNASKNWFATAGLETYGYSNANQATEFGEYAGLRLDSGASGTGYGLLELSLDNALGQTVTQEFRLVPRDADPNQNEFSTMGELAKLVENALKTDNYSSIATGGSLVADASARASFDEASGRLVVSTSSGSFRNLRIQPKNTTTDTANGVTRSDDVNFGTVLGELKDGVNGKSGSSNQFIRADIFRQQAVYDSMGNKHMAISYLVKDQSAGLTNIEWKFKTSLNPNLSTFAEEHLGDKDIYGETFNSLQDIGSASGVLAFDIATGDVLGPSAAGSDSRYSDQAALRFIPRTDSQEADAADIAIDFRRLTSFKGENTIDGDQDGYTMGKWVRFMTEENTGNINGVYSNGKTRTLAKIGLMHVANPAGLQKVGSSYFTQTPNSSASATAKGIDQIFTVGAIDGSSSDSVASKVHGGSLEASNVDLTEELTDMIVTQRSYSASGKIITTSDEMLQEALNLKR